MGKYGNPQGCRNVQIFLEFVRRQPNDTTRCSAAATEWSRTADSILTIVRKPKAN